MRNVGSAVWEERGDLPMPVRFSTIPVYHPFNTIRSFSTSLSSHQTYAE